MIMKELLVILYNVKFCKGENFMDPLGTLGGTV